VQTFSYGNLDKLKTGGLITRLTNDVAQIERVIILSLRIVVRAPLKVIGSLIMAIIIGKNLSWILVAISPLIVICISLLVHRAYPYFMTVQEKLDRVNTRLQENLSGIRLGKGFSKRAL
jgi:ATP-binding cassette subfamily B multidrug efflux pump